MALSGFSNDYRSISPYSRYYLYAHIHFARVLQKTVICCTKKCVNKKNISHKVTLRTKIM